MYDFKCEYCEGIVREQRVTREVFNHSKGVAILENVPIGICDNCHAHYYSAEVLKRLESVINGTETDIHSEQVPVARF